MLLYPFTVWLVTFLVIIVTYSLRTHPGMDFVLRSLMWVAIGLLALGAVGGILHWRDLRRLRRAADREARIVRTLALRHPGTRATPLSSGRYLLSDRVTGKAVGEADISDL